LEVSATRAGALLLLAQGLTAPVPQGDLATQIYIPTGTTHLNGAKSLRSHEPITRTENKQQTKKQRAIMIESSS
jgi:hypothetical protein